MTEADREPFAKMLYALGDTFNEPVSELRAEAYFDALSDLSLDAVLHAGRLAIRESRFFPRPVELREQIAGKVEDRAELAWVAVQELVRTVGYIGTDGNGKPPAFPDEPTRRAAFELYGGWNALCSSLPAHGPELLGIAKQFKALFVAYDHRDTRDAIALQPSREEARKRLQEVKAELVKRGLPTGSI